MLSELLCSIAKALGGCERQNEPTKDLPSPRDIILQSDIKYDKAAQILTIKNIPPEIWLTTVAEMKSMDPIIDAGHTVILTTGFNHDDLRPGDIATYLLPGRRILHRISRIEYDGTRRYFKFKSDRVDYEDPYIIFDEHIEYLLLGVLY